MIGGPESHVVRESGAGISRRHALKKGAMVGGTVLWAAPLVQTIGVGQAFGQVPSPVNRLCGRFTGGGRLLSASGQPVYHGFQLRCGVTGDARPGNNMVVVGHDVAGRRFIFKLDTLSVATCVNDTSIGPPNPPDAGFNTFIGVGTGELRSPDARGPFTPGYRIEFTFTDQGEPGTSDTAKLQIFGPGGALVVDVSGNVGVPPGGTGTVIGNGNNQAHAPGRHRATQEPCT